jgi:hypothetical protein
MNFESPSIGPKAGKNIVTIIVMKENICDVGRLFHIREVMPPLSPSRAKMKLKSFSTRVPKKDGIFFMVALVLFFTLSQKDFSM